jgi:2-hydroxycyclohexanecarboxyl-CoA dehydrogenase
MPVVLTGGGSGIGRAIALRLADEGARVGILDRDASGGAETEAAIRAAGGVASAYGVDITDYAAVEAAVEAFIGVEGEVRGLVINLVGPLNVTKVVLSRMARAEAGRIVSIASDAGRVGSSGESVYAACKGGIVAFSKSVAREMARRGISLNVVSPGPTDTPLFADFDASGRLAKALERAIPMGRLARPDDFPGLVAFLLSDEAAFITGQTISVSGGLTMHG